MAIKVSETTWHCFADGAVSGKFAFPTCEHSVRRDWQAFRYTRKFWCMVISSCMSMAVSDFGADWFLRVNVERVVQRFDGVPQVFFYICTQITIALSLTSRILS